MTEREGDEQTLTVATVDAAQALINMPATQPVESLALLTVV